MPPLFQMNLNQIISRALIRANLSVSDLGMRDLATDYLMEIIQERWESRQWKFRKKDLTLTTANGTEEYALDKRAIVANIVPNTMRGTDPVRRLIYEPSHDFYKKRPFTLESADPYYYREGSYKGFSTNPSAASVITFSSSLTNYTTGTLTVVQGSRRVVIATGSVGLDFVGRWIRVGTDSKAYRITSIDYQSTTVFYLNEPYEGASNAAATLTIGDVGQKASVLGYVSGQLQEEEVQLLGSTAVATTKSFTSIVKISKSDKTHGYITATSNTAGVTNVILDPGETDIDIQTVKLYPIPTKTETINFECYIRHPNLYRPTDSPLFPSEFHNLLVLDLYIRLETEWNKNEVAQVTLDRRDEMLANMISIDNNTDAWPIQQENYEDSDRIRNTNLPATYGYADDLY